MYTVFYKPILHTFFIITILFTLSLILILPVQAGGCFEDPVEHRNWEAVVKSPVWMRDAACVKGTSILGTLPTAENVVIIGETVGWYQVERNDGTRGWVGSTFLQITGDAAGLPKTDLEEIITIETKAETAPSTANNQEEKTVTPESQIKNIPEAHAATTAKTTTIIVDSLYDRLKGYILLQVENNGEAWYVHPDDGKRYYMKDGQTAYDIMRFFGLGITNADLAKLMNGDHTLNYKLRGKIVLKVEAHGEAYYIHPKDGSIHYLKDGAAAYELMRALSLGITNVDLNKLPYRDFNDVLIERGISVAPTTPTPIQFKDQAKPTIVVVNTDTTTDTTVTTTPVATTPIVDASAGPITGQSAYQTGVIPNAMDLKALQVYWLNRINDLRAQAGKRQLVLDQRWIDTATEWAVYMGENNETSHNRPDGKSMHDWIDTKGLAFTERYSEDGWKSNYFTENIAWGYTDNSMSGMYRAMDDTLDFYLAEKSYNGSHYRTIYHDDWNSVGSGFYWKPNGNGSYQVFMAFHYGSLQPQN